jgi:hypothetical protein
VEPIIIPSDLVFADHAFELTAYSGTYLLRDYAFATLVTITIQYTDDDIAGLDEETLTLRRWNETESSWEEAACDLYDRQPDENWLAVPTDQLRHFALFGREYNVYLPLVMHNH